MSHKIHNQSIIPRPFIYIGCFISLLFVLLAAFTCGTFVTIAADEIGVWNSKHEAAETVDEK